MNGYFKPLRRKMGVATLVIACVFAAAWVRSVSSIDMILLPIAGRQFVLVSGSQKFRVFSASKRVMRFVVRQTVNQHSLFEIWSVDQSRFDGVKVSHDTARGEISGAHYADQDKMQLRFISYWSIVLPLTSISAWSLVLRPRTNLESTITPAREHA